MPTVTVKERVPVAANQPLHAQNDPVASGAADVAIASHGSHSFGNTA